MIAEEASGDLEKQTLSSGGDDSGSGDSGRLWCGCGCCKTYHRLMKVRSLPVEEDEEVDPQSVVAFNLATTLYIFVYYLQVLGIITSDLLVDLPELWETLFGWVRFPALTALFPQFDFDEDWQRATVALFALYMIPVYLYLVFTLALDYEGTDLRESTLQLKYVIGWALVGAASLAGAFFAPSPFGALLVVVAAYGFLIVLYWVVKWVVVELITIPMGEKRGTDELDTRLSTQIKEIWFVQFVWLTSFAPIVSGWAYFALFNSNLIVVAVGGVIGLLVVLYMLMFIICLAHIDIHVDSKHRSKFVDWFDIRFVSRSHVVPRPSVQTLTRPFKTWSWWFQALFMIERMILVLIGAAIPTLSGGPVTLGIVIAFSCVVVFFLPYLGRAENIQDVVSRLSNSVILGLGIASSNSEEWRNIIGIIMCVVSFLTAVFWVYYFRPLVLIKIILEDVKYFIALSRWNRKFRFRTVRSHLKAQSYKIKSYEWAALTKKQRALSMCVVRPEVDDSRCLSFIQLLMNGGDLEFSMEALTVDINMEDDETPLNEVEVDDFQLKSLRRYGLQATPFLQMLALNSAGLDDDACVALAGFIPGRLESLIGLSLRTNQIQHKGANALGTLLTATNTLTYLDLFQNRIGDDGAVEIGLALRLNTSLKSLSLWLNEIGDRGATALFQTLQENKSLTSLHLRNNQIGEGSAAALSSLLKVNKSLKSLFISRNLIDIPMLKQLVTTMASNSTLERLEVREQGEAPSFSPEIQNILAGMLQHNHVVRFMSSEERFLMKARAGANLLLPGRTVPDTGSDSESEASTSEAEVEDPNSWSKAAWSFAEDGLCSMISTALSFVSDNDRGEVKRVANAVNAKGQSMLDLVLENGLSAKLEVVKALVYAGFDLNKKVGDAPDSKTYKQMLEECDDEQVKAWAGKTKDALERRFILETGQPIYQTHTCKVARALDLETQARVALKILHTQDLKREATIRELLQGDGSQYILQHLTHTETFMAFSLAEKTLRDVIESERFIAQDGTAIKRVALDCAKALRFLASRKVAHMDFKPRNVVQVVNASTGSYTYKLIDFDSAILHGQPVDLYRKYSTAYVAPELARRLMPPVQGNPEAATEDLKGSELYDAWAFGCVVFELFTGQHLFGEIASPMDSLVREEDKEELRTWVVFDLVRADKVLNRNLSMEERLKDKAVVADLLGKCLQGSFKRRTGFLNVLAHPLFQSNT